MMQGGGSLQDVQINKIERNSFLQGHLEHAKRKIKR